MNRPSADFDLESPYVTETLAVESVSGTPDDDDDRDDEHDGENEVPIREVDDATEAPEEFEVDDEDDADDDLDASLGDDDDDDDETDSDGDGDAALDDEV